MQVVDATEGHLRELLRKPLRQQDVNEWFLLSGGGRLKDILKDNIVLETSRACLNSRGDCIAMWGIVGNLGWLVGSVEAQGLARRIHHLAAGDLGHLARMAGTKEVYAVVLKSDAMAHKWHLKMGFELVAEQAFMGMPMLLYRREF